MGILFEHLNMYISVNGKNKDLPIQRRSEKRLKAEYYEVMFVFYI